MISVKTTLQNLRLQNLSSTLWWGIENDLWRIHTEQSINYSTALTCVDNVSANIVPDVKNFIKTKLYGMYEI